MILGRSASGAEALILSPEGRVSERVSLNPGEVPAWIHQRERALAPRWVWADAPRWYPTLLAAGVRINRCHDLRLNHILLAGSALIRGAGAQVLREASGWDAPPHSVPPVAGATLFDWESGTAASALPESADAAAAEYLRQRDAIRTSADPNRLELLTAAESAGALIACELESAGLPWHRGAHEEILEQTLGARDGAGVPAHVAAAAARVRHALGDPTVSLDSQPKLLRALHRAGVLAESTSQWELSEYSHPAIAPLLEYKKLMRLQSANGWAWLDEWVSDGRFRPVYVPSGVVTGRWASAGGGALQIPRQLRDAVRADPGWTLVVADVAQLEPRVLGAMASDHALADAARGRDLYSGIVDAGTVASRSEAKIAMLGAMYGATSGEAGRLVPRLRRTFPKAMALVDEAARTGEDGGAVSTWLGRTSPGVSGEWQNAQHDATLAEASDQELTRARRWARDRGRFTRNFIVQGTAAEWALCWLADLRARLHALPAVSDTEATPLAGPVASHRAHLAFFLHDEVIIHAPVAHAELASRAVQEAADAATRLLFGDFPLDFPLDTRVSHTAAKA